MLSHSAPAVVSAVITPARTRRSHSGRRFCIETAVEYTSANDWSSSRAARTAKPERAERQRDERAEDVVGVPVRDGDKREQADDVAEHLGEAVAGHRAGERRARAARVPHVVGGQRRERDGDGDHGVGGRPVAGPGAVGECGQRVPQQLDEQVAHHDEHGRGGVPAQHPDGAERPDGQQRGRRPGDQDIAPLGTAGATVCAAVAIVTSSKMLQPKSCRMFSTVGR